MFFRRVGSCIAVNGLLFEQSTPLSPTASIGFAMAAVCIGLETPIRSTI